MEQDLLQASTSASSCTVGVFNAQVTYAGPEIQIAGLDQVNLFLPATLWQCWRTVGQLFFQTAQQVYGPSNTVSVTIR